MVLFAYPCEGGLSGVHVGGNCSANLFSRSNLLANWNTCSAKFPYPYLNGTRSELLQQRGSKGQVGIEGNGEWTCAFHSVSILHSMVPRRLHLFACLQQRTWWENLSGEINTCQKLYRISQGDDLYESLYLTKREERSIFHALWEN